MKSFDLAVIGSGPGGYRSAVLGTMRGLRVAIVERGDWGGCCLNRGCVPKKDWYHTARLMAAARNFSVRGVTGELTVDFAAAWRHQRGVVTKVRESYLDYMKRLGIARYGGTATFVSPNRFRISGPTGEEVLQAEQIIIATGSEPWIPDVFRNVSSRILTTDDLFDHPPPTGDRIAVIGGGVIAIEFAYILTMLSKEVVWLSRSDPLAHVRFSPQARSSLGRALSEYAITPMQEQIMGAKAEGKQVVLTLKGGQPRRFDWVLVATGRRPFTAGLCPEVGGLEQDARGFLSVGNCLETSANGVYAIGDCVGGNMTANQALHDATLTIANIVAGKPYTRRTPEKVPEVLYSAVELARVGLDDDDAESAGFEPAIGFAAFETSPKALGQDDSRGFVRIISDMESGQFLGGEIVGDEAGELIHLLAMLTDNGSLKTVTRTAFNHPARAEEVLNSVEALAHQWNLTGQIFGAES